MNDGGSHQAVNQKRSTSAAAPNLAPSGRNSTPAAGPAPVPNRKPAESAQHVSAMNLSRRSQPDVLNETEPIVKTARQNPRKRAQSPACTPFAPFPFGLIRNSCRSGLHP